MNSPWPSKVQGGLDAHEKAPMGAGLFVLCNKCGETCTRGAFAQNFEVCPHCAAHHPLSTTEWQRLLLDAESWKPWDTDLAPSDPLQFQDGKSYPERVIAASLKSGTRDAIDTGEATMNGIPLAFGLFVFAFMGGSMGGVVGEKLARLFERAAEKKLPVVLLSASGGARMQEGILSLMQMAKSVAAREAFKASGMPFISVLLHPTTGGVAASYAFLGDVNIGEPGALIGFAGPRVIETTIHQTLPEGFQRAEFLLQRGMLDRVTSRLAMKQEFTTLLQHLCRA